MAKVWTYGGYLCHVSRATPSRKEGSLPAKLDKVSDVTTNQKFYEANSRIMQLNEELRKTLVAMEKLSKQASYYESIVKEKNKKASLAKKYANGSPLTNEESKEASSMSNDEIKRYRASSSRSVGTIADYKTNYDSVEKFGNVESGPIKSIDKIINTMKNEYDSAYQKYQKIATLSSKLSSMKPVSQTAAAYSYDIMRNIHDIVYDSIKHLAEVVADNMTPLSKSSYGSKWRVAISFDNMPRPHRLSD